MGMVQTYEALDCEGDFQRHRAACTRMRNMTIEITSALVELADPETGAWWQLPTFPGRTGNYLESSSTVLFIFSILKALRIGLIPASPRRIHKAAVKAYRYTTKNFVTDVGHGNGTIGFDKTVAVCSLNSTATYEYYTSQPIVPNSLLGESVFIMASLEMEALRGRRSV